jgi:hypothetical protein
MEDGGPLMSIGELARRAGLPVRTCARACCGPGGRPLVRPSAVLA